MLDTILEQNMLKTWTIFQEQSGNIVVKLRFYWTHGGQGSLNLTRGDQGDQLLFQKEKWTARSKRHRKSL